ncbi:GNAT family N-acetyltransferase [Gallibacterium trehalosifermentans]|uniref:GNAT family N-acetyltransferase n=1 Tax=Gallibacterium trehalosifermentans TaxID=516935 RepID=A0ABV6H2B0_9PAST
MLEQQIDFSRQVIILAGRITWREQQLQQIAQHYPTQSILYCGVKPPTVCSEQFTFFSLQNSRNVLGQEFSVAIFDACQQENLAFHLDTLAIIAATLRAGGCLFILLPTWHNLPYRVDIDSLRWNSINEATTTPNFLDWLVSRITHYQLPIYQEPATEIIFPDVNTDKWGMPTAAINAQQQQLQCLLQSDADIYLLIAGRGRGKSALAGQFIKKLAKKVLVTAANQQAIKTLQQFAAPNKVDFLAPDLLLAKLIQQEIDEDYAWLIVDEAAMLPLAILQQFCGAFPKVLLTTTSEGYEGTGKGFLLKLEKSLSKTVAYLDLTLPLRWQAGDLLEQWVNDLALLQPKDVIFPYQAQASYSLYSTQHISATHKLNRLYQLLSLAHYRTSLSDFRRLLDGQNQQFVWYEVDQQPIGIVWGLKEGNIQDTSLVQGIRQGYRRPKGNLVAQALCFQLNDERAAKLRSLRISRIAVLPEWQQQGVGSQLIQQLIQQCSGEFDFLSVSFGYSAELFAFWLRNGFQLVGVSAGTEASSGNYSVMMIYPLSVQGEQFFQPAKILFQRNFMLSEHSLVTALSKQLRFDKPDWQLTAWDWQAIADFIDHQRTLTVAYPTLKRFFYHYPNEALTAQLALLLQPFYPQKKQQLLLFKQQLLTFLQKINKKI